MSITDVGKLDSTDRVDNSTINALQADVKNGGLYKPDTKFGQRPTNTKTLLMIRVTLETKDEKGEKKPYKQTFYLDPELTSVVAVKMTLVGASLWRLLNTAFDNFLHEKANLKLKPDVLITLEKH